MLLEASTERKLKETGVREILFRWSYVDPTGETGKTQGIQTGIMENNMFLTPVFRGSIHRRSVGFAAFPALSEKITGLHKAGMTGKILFRFKIIPQRKDQVASGCKG